MGARTWPNARRLRDSLSPSACCSFDSPCECRKQRPDVLQPKRIAVCVLHVRCVFKHPQRCHHFSNRASHGGREDPRELVHFDGVPYQPMVYACAGGGHGWLRAWLDCAQVHCDTGCEPRLANRMLLYHFTGLQLPWLPRNRHTRIESCECSGQSLAVQQCDERIVFVSTSFFFFFVRLPLTSLLFRFLLLGGDVSPSKYWCLQRRAGFFFFICFVCTVHNKSRARSAPQVNLEISINLSPTHLLFPSHTLCPADYISTVSHYFAHSHREVMAYTRSHDCVDLYLFFLSTQTLC
ncbi:transmembrane protein, putative [Bodo saltans]|uniref:Transmembrane protein, putative n=1 Tax=Bodo saltans TaxID=75058 RepID=A0A0S4JIR5_BODSA|nr:transmembrane protein, putative [Bodo saltans]|eukprot:CUG88309.1 transmembrane protein, putative [Bodo saltans]